MRVRIHLGMEARTLQTLLGLDLSENDQLLFLIALVLMLLGLALAFAGRKVWKHVMSFVGAIIGGLLGFVFGAAIGGWIVGFIGGMVGSMIGGAVFVFLARVGIAAVAATLAFIVAAGGTSSEIAGGLVGLIVFIATFIYAETAVGIVTAIVGGLLFGAGMFLLDLNMSMTVLSVLALAVFGGAFQMSVLKEERDRPRAHHAAHHPVTAAAVSPPKAPPMPGRMCQKCGGQLTYIPEYNRYFCYRCQRYE